MIFVTVGTNETPFDRLLLATDRLETTEEIVAQHGSSAVRPARAVCVPFLSFDEMVAHVDRARVVVTHAGVGSILLALSRGHVPVVAPRLHRYGEAVDDHQVPLAHRLAERGLVTVVEDLDGGLAAAVAGERRVAAGAIGASRLADELRGELAALTADPRPPRR